MNLPVLKLSTSQHGCASSAQRWKRAAIPRSPAVTPGFLVCCSLSVIEWHRPGKRPFFRWCVDPRISPGMLRSKVPGVRQRSLRWEYVSWTWRCRGNRRDARHFGGRELTLTPTRGHTQDTSHCRRYSRAGHLCYLPERRQAPAYYA
jgi:hypothetical protein